MSLPHWTSDALIEQYRHFLHQFGPTHGAVQWSSADAQRRRFRVLAEAVRDVHSVVDVGCGLGDLLPFLRTERAFSGHYLGLDFVPEFVQHCRRRFKPDTKAQFRCFDAQVEDFPYDKDCFLVSGMFNNLLASRSQHLAWIRLAVARMYDAATKVVAFNSLSATTQNQADDLFYTDPNEMWRWCATNLTHNAQLRDDYSPRPETGIATDYTIYLPKLDMHADGVSGPA